MIVIPYLLYVKEAADLRKILSQNIKEMRKALYLTQAKLAERAGISVFHIIEIEQCKTWVSDKTLVNIARALNMEAYELLLPGLAPEPYNQKEKRRIQRQIAGLIKVKEDLLRQKSTEAMEDLALEILHLFDNKA